MLKHSVKWLALGYLMGGAEQRAVVCYALDGDDIGGVVGIAGIEVKLGCAIVVDCYTGIPVKHLAQVGAGFMAVITLVILW